LIFAMLSVFSLIVMAGLADGRLDGGRDGMGVIEGSFA